MDIATSDLEGIALDWFVTQCQHLTEPDFLKKWKSGCFRYSSNLALGDPIIDREKISVFEDAAEPWKAIITPNENEPHYYFRYYGPTKLVAAMRCFVVSQLGDTVTLPDFLLDFVTSQ